MQIVEFPAEKEGLRERLSRLNKTHKVITQYSTDGSVIGPKAEDFFPQRWAAQTTYVD